MYPNFAFRCAPEASVIAQGKNDSLRARAILRSLVPLEDLRGVLSRRFNIAMPGLQDPSEAGSDIPSGLIPNHKQSMALFLERVYGIEDRDLFFALLEEAFLPDLRVATMLEKVHTSEKLYFPRYPVGTQYNNVKLIFQAEGESEMGLALNRYIGNSIIPTLTKYRGYYADADSHSPLLEATLHTVYRLSKTKMLTNVQRQAVSDFLIAITNEVSPGMLLKLLKQLTKDLAKLNEYSNVALRVRLPSQNCF